MFHDVQHHIFRPTPNGADIVPRVALYTDVHKLGTSNFAFCFTVLNFVTIGRSVAEIWHYFIDCFEQWWRSVILDSSDAYWDHPRFREDYLWLYRCAKFGWNRCSSFDNMKVLIFCAFGVKTPIPAPK